MRTAGTLGLIWGFSLEFIRDRTAMFFTFVFPPIFTVVVGFIIGAFSQPTSHPVGLVAGEDSAHADGITAAIEANPLFALEVGDLASQTAALDDGDLKAVLVIPPGFAGALSEQDRAQVEIYYDNRDQDAIRVVIPALSAIVDAVDRGLAGNVPRIDVVTTPNTTRHLSTIDFVGPGIISFSIMQLGVFSAINLVARREKKVLKRVGATPATRSMVLIAGIIQRVIIAAIQASIQLVILVVGFGLDFFNPLAVIGVLALGTLVFVGIGFTASSFARTEEAMFPIVQLISLPMFVLAGVFFPLDVFPQVLQWFANLLPLTYMADAVRQLMIEADGRYDMWLNLAVMLAWVVGGFAVAVWRFSWE
ncbi:MAG: ABC transporter permease [Chloroflexi bacterium]|nr:ABC transporter permease [Chloroflexota bacterium]MDE2862997.1 ABC transporter permease [Chloroflexota bacterium]